MGSTEETEVMTPELEDENTVKRISKEDWLAQGKQLFGDDPRQWKFKCACCGHVQTMADFSELRDLGLWQFDTIADTQVAYYACIGRYDPRIPEEELGRLDGEGKSPCDYTLRGFFSLAKTVVVDDDGEEYRVFEFATD